MSRKDAGLPPEYRPRPSASHPFSQTSSCTVVQMKAVSAVILALVASASGHAIFQKISINGADQGQLRGVRAPNSNYPLQNVNDAELACNKNLQNKDNNVHTIAPGARIGAWWGHVIGGPQGSNDPDHPIAASHKGQ